MKVNEESINFIFTEPPKGYKDGLVPVWIRIIINGNRDGFPPAKNTS